MWKTDITNSSFFKSYFCRTPLSIGGHTFMASTWKGNGGEWVLKFFVYFRILLLLKNRSIVHFSECGGKRAVGGRHKTDNLLWTL